jgi:hypothetical protein
MHVHVKQAGVSGRFLASSTVLAPDVLSFSASQWDSKSPNDDEGLP